MRKYLPPTFWSGYEIGFPKGMDTDPPKGLFWSSIKRNNTKGRGVKQDKHGNERNKRDTSFGESREEVMELVFSGLTGFGKNSYLGARNQARDTPKAFAGKEGTIEQEVQ